MTDPKRPGVPGRFGSLSAGDLTEAWAARELMRLLEQLKLVAVGACRVMRSGSGDPITL